MQRLLTGILLSLTLVMYAPQALAQGDTTMVDSAGPYGWFAIHLVKVALAYQNGQWTGGQLQYETGIGLRHFSLAASLRYTRTAAVEEADDVPVPAHLRAELQGRFYPIHFGRPLYLGVLANATSEATFGIGAMLGVQTFIHQRFIIDTGLGIQTRNTTNPHDAPIFLRLHLNLGVAFPRYKYDAL